MNPLNLFRRRRPASLPVQALEALPSPALPRRVPALFFGAGSTATSEDEALVIASGALRQHGPREAFAPGSLADQAEAWLADGAR